MPYAQDGAITYETVIARYNADLANTLGNLVNRTVSMCHKYFGGTLEKKAPAEAVDQESRHSAWIPLKNIKSLWTTCILRMRSTVS